LHNSEAVGERHTNAPIADSKWDGRPLRATFECLASHRTPVRRVGNSNVVSIPRELETRGFAPGTSVLVDELESGELRIIPTEQVRARIRDVGHRLVGEHAEALRILAEHDPAGGTAER